jgi:hypothetical protein
VKNHQTIVGSGRYQTNGTVVSIFRTECLHVGNGSRHPPHLGELIEAAFGALAIREGAASTEAAKIVGVTLQIIGDWLSSSTHTVRMAWSIENRRGESLDSTIRIGLAGSLTFGAAVRLGLLPPAASRRQCWRLTTARTACCCPQIAVATISPRKGVSAPVQCPCPAHLVGFRPPYFATNHRRFLTTNPGGTPLIIRGKLFGQLRPALSAATARTNFSPPPPLPAVRAAGRTACDDHNDDHDCVDV